MIITSESIKAISAALLKFQGEVEGVGRTKDNKAFGNFKYATLENVRDTAVPVLQDVGVVFVQSGGAIVEGVMAMSTRLIHAESGEWIEGTMDIALGKRDPQGVGSAQTYAQRYHLMAMLGLPPVDDDGEAAIDRNNSRPMQSNKKAVQGDDGPIDDTVARTLFPTIQTALMACTTTKQLEGAWSRYLPVMSGWSELMQENCDGVYQEMRKHLAEHDGDARKASRNTLEGILRAAVSMDDLKAKWQEMEPALKKIGKDDVGYLSGVKEEMKAVIAKVGKMPNFDTLEPTHEQKIAGTI